MRVVPDRGLSGTELAELVVAWFFACGAALWIGLRLAMRRWPA